MLPFPALVVLGLAAVGTGAVVYLRRREPGQVTAAQVGLVPGTPTSGTFTEALMPLVVRGNIIPPDPPPEAPKVEQARTEEQRLAQFKMQWMPAYMKSEGCKKFYWGFNALQVGQDAAAYNGAGFVSGMIDWILTTMPEIKVITDMINLKFRFKLNKYDIGQLDDDGWLQTIGNNLWRIDAWTGQQGDAPPSVPLPDAGGGWIKVWMNKREGGLYTEDDKTITIIRPILGNIYAGMPTWEWTWMTYQKNIRKLFRQDKINISMLASQKRAGCGDMRWWLVTRNAADEIYK